VRRFGLRDAVFLVAGGLIGLAVAFLWLKGVSDLSVVTAILGVLILGGQLALGYRQTQGEEEGRQHELRIRNEDLFAQHSRDIARLTLLPLMDAEVGSSPECNIMVDIPDRSGAAKSPIEALWNWKFGQEHVRSSHSALTGYWELVVIARAGYIEAARAWQGRFLNRLAELVASAYGSEFGPGEPWNPGPNQRGYNIQGFRNLVRNDPKTFDGWGFAVSGVFPPVKEVNVASNWHLVYSPEIAEPDAAKVKAIARELASDPELIALLEKEKQESEKVAKTLKDLAPILRDEVPRVELSGRLAGECEICRDLVPRISRPGK
jgi:hypothetical protein